MGWLKQVYRNYFLKPVHLRRLYREIKKRPISSVVEIGISDPEQTIKLLSIASEYSGEVIRYAGIDLFEARPDDQMHLPLKVAHKKFAQTSAKVRLIPGNPMIGLSRFANTLVDTDLLLISSEIDSDSMVDSWFYVPRMLNSASLVFQEREKGQLRELVLLDHAQIEKWAKKGSVASRSAA